MTVSAACTDRHVFVAITIASDLPTKEQNCRLCKGCYSKTKCGGGHTQENNIQNTDEVQIPPLQTGSNGRQGLQEHKQNGDRNICSTRNSYQKWSAADHCTAQTLCIFPKAWQSLWLLVENIYWSIGFSVSSLFAIAFDLFAATMTQWVNCSCHYPRDWSQWTGTQGPGVLWWADHPAVRPLHQGWVGCEALTWTRTFEDCIECVRRPCGHWGNLLVQNRV